MWALGIAKWRRRTILALAVLLVPFLNVGAAPGPTNEVETAGGRWRVQGVSPAIRSLTTDIAGDAPTNARELRGLLGSGYTISPIVANREDFTRFLVGKDFGSNSLADEVLRLMQAVPEVPDRYSDARFQPIRDAFGKACSDSIGEYRSGAIRLYNSTQPALDLNRTENRQLGRDYERNCLTPLEQVPAQIQAVIGVLLNSRGIPWCSATILDDHKLLTSKHCFVDPTSGHAEDERRQLLEGRIGFATPVRHHGVAIFTVERSDPNSVPLGTFGPRDDFLIVNIQDATFEKHAYLRSEPLTNAVLPLPTWVVGSNANLSDVNLRGAPLAFTRGSSPKACAILEVSANGCLYHVCQTGHATSGAGLLSIGPDDKVTLLGVHKAAIAEASGCELTPPLDLKLNLAINITSGSVG